MRSCFKAISLSHQTAPLDVRECFALTETESKQFASTVRELLGLTELLVESTCNQTELYYVADADYSEQLVKLLCLQKGVSYQQCALYFRQLSNADDAILHLFRVSVGLD